MSPVVLDDDMCRVAVVGLIGWSVFMECHHFHQPSETIFAEMKGAEAGGKGCNQAIAAARMGATVSFLCAVGDDLHGEQCEQFLSSQNLKSVVAVKKGINTSFAFILTEKSGANQVTVCHGAALEEKDVLLFEDEIKNCDIVLLQLEVSRSVNEAVINLARRYNKRIILNPAPAKEYVKEWAKDIYMITPNEHESHIVDISCCQNHIVTVGAEGCIINSTTKIPAVAVTPKDTTGAGDVFNGVLAAELAKGASIQEAAFIANVAAAISTTGHMAIASIPWKSDVLSFLNSNR